VSIEFNNQDSRLGYLNDKLDDLLDGINASYGEELFNELVTRLERTINDFNEEISVLTEEVKGNSEKRAEIIHTLMEGQEMTQGQAGMDEAGESGGNLDSEIMSEWEKRLEGLK
jgi:cell division septum initiation protein DivIVA